MDDGDPASLALRRFFGRIEEIRSALAVRAEEIADLEKRLARLGAKKSSRKAADSMATWRSRRNW